MLFNEFEGETFTKIETTNTEKESNINSLENMILVSNIVGAILRHKVPCNVFISLNEIISLGYHKDESLYIFEIEHSRKIQQPNQITNIIEGKPIRYTTLKRDNEEYKLEEVAYNRYCNKCFIVIERSTIVSMMNDIIMSDIYSDDVRRRCKDYIKNLNKTKYTFDLKLNNLYMYNNNVHVFRGVNAQNYIMMFNLENYTYLGLKKDSINPFSITSYKTPKFSIIPDNVVIDYTTFKTFILSCKMLYSQNEDTVFLHDKNTYNYLHSNNRTIFFKNIEDDRILIIENNAIKNIYKQITVKK